MLSEEQKKQQEEYEKLRAHTQGMKRKIIIVLCCTVGAIVLMLGAVKLVERFENQQGQEIPDGTYEFYPVYEGDIMENAEYLGLNRLINYCADPSGYGLTQSITEDNLEEFDESVLFLCTYIQTIINGDAEAYNELFNATYYKDNDPKASFSQQMLHNIKITFMSESEEGSERLITYRLEYMIHRNDGTYRRDVDSDAIRPQDITVRVSENGQILIERVITYYSKQ